jgi:aminoglycoside 3-N-acetyltransferase
LAGRTELVEDLGRLGVVEGDLLMVHAALRSVGRIIGGVNVLVQALFDSVGTEGTITAYVDFEPFFEEDDDLAEIPVFDKRIAHAARAHGFCTRR